MTDKLSHKPIRAIKHPFKFLLLGVFVFFGFFFTNEAILGATLFEDDFENCIVDNELSTCAGWENSYYWKITDENCYSGKCIISPTTTSAYARRSGTYLATGTFSFWFYFEEEPTNSQAIFFKEWGSPTQTAQLTSILFMGNSILYYKEVGLIFETIFTFTLKEWHFIAMEFDLTNPTSTCRFFYEGTWTNWLSPAYTRTEINRVDFFNYEMPNNFQIDEISEFDEACQFYQTWYNCQNAGCCWYYFHLFYRNICVECPVGECESGPDTCSNCLTEVNCEAEDLCYWFEGVCKFGTGSCGEGLELAFCENQTECENAGGYWYNDFCWLSPPISLTSWEDYYTEYGDYATASAWISKMASSTSLFLGQIGGFLAIFEGNFDLMEAFERGQNFGSAIPTARGYLTIFDDFLGGFPIGEFFVFLLIFMIAVGVFRIMRNLFQLIKFW